MHAPTPSFRRPRARLRLLGLTSLLVVSALVAAPPLGAAAATPYGTNLVKNPGAEKGTRSWDVFGNASGDIYNNDGGTPSKAERNRIGGGQYFFYAGLYDHALNTCGDLQQSWTLQGIGSAIDSGKVKVRLQGYVATQGADSFFAHLDLYFRDADNHGSAGIQRQVTQTNQHYVKIDVKKTLPKHTRKLRLHLWADGSAPESSGDCPAFWDKLSVTLSHT